MEIFAQGWNLAGLVFSENSEQSLPSQKSLQRAGRSMISYHTAGMHYKWT